MSPKPILSENALGPFSPPFLSSVSWPHGAEGDQPQGTWTVLWAKLSLPGVLGMRKQLGVGILCGPCSFRRAIAVPIELVLVPARLPFCVVRKETSPQGQPVPAATCQTLRFISSHMWSLSLPGYTHVSLGMSSVGKPCLFTL